MDKIRKVVTISLSPNAEDSKLIHSKYQQITGTDNIYEHRNIFDDLYNSYRIKWVHNNITLKQAQEIAEPIRIANPDQNVSINTDDNCFIGNTTWNDQMKMFWEYPTYTDQGTTLAKKRKAEAEALGLIVAWE